MRRGRRALFLGLLVLGAAASVHCGQSGSDGVGAGGAADASISDDGSATEAGSQDDGSRRASPDGGGAGDASAAADGASGADGATNDGASADSSGLADASAGDATPGDAGGQCKLTIPNGIGCSAGHTSYCVVDIVDAGTIDPFRGCMLCDPSVSTTDWTAAPNGTSCGGQGGVCNGGACSTGAALNAPCSDGNDCASGFCARNDATGVAQCAISASQPGQACTIGTCAAGLVCIPVTNCDPSGGSICYGGYRNVCL